MSLVVFSCDAYNDLWEDFFRYLNIYWEDRLNESYLVNNRNQFECKGIKVINAGDGDWSTRARIALEQINTPYVMIFLEDYFLAKKIDNRKIEEAVLFMESEGIHYYKLELSAVRSYQNWKSYKDTKYIFNIPRTQNYGIDTSISLWNKDFLLELLGKGDYSAWKFELDRCEDAKHPERYIDRKCVLDSRFLVLMCPMVIQGKYYPKSIKYMQKLGHQIDTSKRLVMNKKEVIRYKIKRLFSASPFGRKYLKFIGRKLGYNFMSDLYKPEN